MPREDQYVPVGDLPPGSMARMTMDGGMPFTVVRQTEGFTRTRYADGGRILMDQAVQVWVVYFNERW